MRAGGDGRFSRRTHRAALGGILATLMLASAACGGGSSADPQPSVGPSSDGSPVSATPTGPANGDPPTTPAADDTHVVAAPGRLTGGVVSADLLVVGSTTLSRRVIRQVRRVEGVTSVEPISLAQVSVQDRLLGVAAVDPATYRRYTNPVSATTLAVWRRVAAGDLAVDRVEGKRLRSIASAVPLGSGVAAPQLRLGAIAPQIPQIAAVVNRTWIRPLGMRPRNALIVSTGITAPAGVQAPVQKVVGKNVSVQRLDVAERIGLDPSVEQTAVVVGSVADAVGVYRYSVSGGRVIPDPAWVAANISTEPVPILGDVTCNRVLFPQLRGALSEIVTNGLGDAIHPSEYGGCYNARFIAGTTQLSNHAFGLAVDLNVPGNLRGTVGQINRQVVAILQKWGFTWGGTWRYTDPMHFELNSIVAPQP